MTTPDNYKMINRYVLLAGVLTGTLDALSAIILNPGVQASNIFRFIASGLFGNAAFGSGNEFIIYGVLLHYVISFSFCIAFLRFYPSLINVFKFNYLLVLVIGLSTWMIMNLIILPLSNITPKPFTCISIFKNIVALIFAFGLPIVWIGTRAHTCYQSKTKKLR